MKKPNFENIFPFDMLGKKECHCYKCGGLMIYQGEEEDICGACSGEYPEASGECEDTYEPDYNKLDE
jgi:hypothetical protein